MPNAGAKRFGYFWASAKVTRCKSETASRNTRRNGYSPKTPKAWSAQRPPRQPQTENVSLLGITPAAKSEPNANEKNSPGLQPHHPTHDRTPATGLRRHRPQPEKR
ncbi:hypothetical protein DXT77_04405 [Pseudomonas sp. 91RF]|nr:hypothetical protein DXT77_04405 [Pseudomonas sp. 91RF]